MLIFLFNYSRDELTSKYVNYSDSSFCNKDGTYSIVACGYQSNGKYSISQIDIGADTNDKPVINQ